MPKIKYDWNALKLEFLQGPWLTVEAFRKYKGWPSRRKSQWWTEKAVGWAKDKEKLKKKALAKATVDLVKGDVRDIKKVRARQARLARWLQLKGAAALKDLEPVNTEDARKLVATGLKEEREALGIGKKGGISSHLTQVNVNLPKTRFDELLEGMNYEETLRFIAELKRERARRSGEAVIVDGAAQTR